MRFLLVALLGIVVPASTLAQRADERWSIRGAVTIAAAGTRAPARNVAMTIAELKRTVLTDENGAYELDGVPRGHYDLIAHLDRVPDVVKRVDVTSGDLVVDFQLTLAPVTEQVTVTAAGSAEAINSSFQPALSVGALELAQKNPLSLGEALQDQLGVANRSFGPGTGRPVIRGFSGDRVLVLQDGLRVGGIASQSGDEVEPMDVLSLDRVEVVKGPATLLYGSNAMGGVVNGVSTNYAYKPGLTGYLTAFGGTNNRQAGGSGGFQLGARDLLFFASGTDQKANDYQTPLGTVLNSFARAKNLNAGVGWFPGEGWFAFKYTEDRRNHGIPVRPEEVDFESLQEHRHAYEARGGLRDPGGFIESGNFSVSYNSYKASEYEFESDENVTELDSVATNKNFNYRASLNHRRSGRLSGAFGVSGFTRNYVAVGAEAPAPRTRQDSFAAYSLERLDFEHIGFQFGGRLEQNGYNPEGSLRARNFTGFAGSAGARVPLWSNGSIAANYQRSFRAPALEELYNNGPHPGILVFDIGNPDLAPEHGDSLDVSLRHAAGRVRLESSVYYYRLSNFVYPAFTGQVDGGSNLPIINYAQGNSRYRGAEARIETRVSSTIWFDARVDYVRAQLAQMAKPLPRIPPLRGTLGLDWRHKAVSVRPELSMANRQDRVYDNEAPTAGYVVFNLNASYTIAAGRTAHIFSINGYNLGNALYRNHLSFLKSYAPQIGRSVRLIYTLRF